MNIQFSTSEEPFYFMAKPVGFKCNLDCTYCYYLEKEDLYADDPSNWSMSEELLERFIEQYIYINHAHDVLFTWHGGEPLLKGIEFYKKALILQQKYAEGRTIVNSLQTNGTLINDEWAQFFKENNFLIGISIDGPEHCHDHYRKYRNDKPSFLNVMRGIDFLKKHKVEFNTLTVINDYNVRYPLQVYNFLKEIGSIYMQFTPIVDAIDSSGNTNPKDFKEVEDILVTDQSVKPLQYSNFLIKIFDEWVKKDVGIRFVITFDALLANLMEVPPPICIYAKTCGRAAAIEFNGDVYSCDHFVFPQYKVGNINDKHLLTLINSEMQQDFGTDKFDKLPNYCKKCEFLNLCYGECPKNRIIKSPEGEAGLNYLCKGFKEFYKHTIPYLKYMANEISQQRNPNNVMQWIKNQ